ncbi:pleckstrin homology-like domain family B member 1 isoform X2 [Toxorhynchites rutilus septentrionalis]|uniref:pleckstrin homology-like domain family B member 1 isoform X2 n=1 Tax=Toxorhynchites rutilus septentrionalis TaxID=329112 RepID=UPI00247AC183|nr:pleckstrin homology-like domain family B member 1 isoform X2 [Toxorhynchites rutilus septentrionalis]
MAEDSTSNRVYVNLPPFKMVSNLETKQLIGSTDRTFNKSSELDDVEEMLTICAEYEQNNSENCTKLVSSIHMAQNRIKTNGSLPREKSLNVKHQRSTDVSSTPRTASSLTFVVNNNIGLSQESITKEKIMESPSQNSYIQNNENILKQVPQSPRTKIRTCVNANKTYELNEYDSLINDFEKKIKEEIKIRMNSENTIDSETKNDCLMDNNNYILNDLNIRRNRTLEDIRILKRMIAELQCEEDEIFRDLDLEEALLSAELTTENIAINQLEQDLMKVQSQIHRLEAQRNASRVMQETQQAKLKQTISIKQNQTESLKQMIIEDQAIQNELDRVSESLENDRKLFEDLEFQYLEEESEWISKREELLMRLKFLKRRIFRMRSHTNGLEQQTYFYQQMVCDDTKDLEQYLLVMIQELEQKRETLRELEKKMMCLRNCFQDFEKTEDAQSKKYSLLSQSLPAWDSSFLEFVSNNDPSEHDISNNTDGQNNQEINDALESFTRASNGDNLPRYLHKLGATFKGWSKRWFVLDRVQQAFVYYADKSEKRARGGAYFHAIEEVYLDHLNTSKSDRPDCTFVVKTKKRIYNLQAATSAATRIWIDVIMTGAFGNEDFTPIP